VNTILVDCGDCVQLVKVCPSSREGEERRNPGQAFGQLRHLRVTKMTGIVGTKRARTVNA